MRCPKHNTKLKISHGFTPLDGFDPKMKRWACFDCPDYWYTSPKHCKPMSLEEVKQVSMLEAIEKQYVSIILSGILQRSIDRSD